MGKSGVSSWVGWSAHVGPFGAWFFGLWRLKERSSGIHTCLRRPSVVPVVDRINHVPGSVLVTRAARVISSWGSAVCEHSVVTP